MKNEFAGKYVVAVAQDNERLVKVPCRHGRKVLAQIIKAGPAGIAIADLKPDAHGKVNNHIRWDMARGRVKVLSRPPRAARSASKSAAAPKAQASA